MARLTRIEGIRPKHVAALEDANITRPSQLVAHRDLQALSEQTHISLEELKDIQQKARLEVSSQKQRYSVISFFLVGVIGLVSFYTTQWVLEYDFHGDLKSTSSDSATQTRYQTAYDAYQNEEYIKAMAAIERGLKEIKDNEADYHSDFLNLQGLIYDKQGELELALEYYRKAEDVDPTNGYATNNIGAILQIQNNFESAEANYRKAIDKQPETALFHSNLGLLLYKQKRYPDAITYLHKAAELEPENHDTKVSLANAYLQNKQIQIAIDNYLELLEQGKASRDDMLYNLGLSYERLKQYPKAISILNRSRKLLIFTLKPYRVLPWRNQMITTTAQPQTRRKN